MQELITGTQILYVPNHANEDENHPDAELGFVTSQRGDTIFCRYWSKYHPGELRTKANSEGTPVGNIVIKDSMPQVLIEAALARIATQ